MREKNQKQFDRLLQLPQNLSNLAAIATKALIDSIGAFSFVAWFPCLLHPDGVFGPRSPRVLRSRAFLFLMPMATRAKTVCRHPACGRLVDAPGYCETHAALHRRQSDERRGTSHERGYNSKWQKARETYLREHPLCECDDCRRDGLAIPATVVDHIKPHKLKEAKDSGDPAAIAMAQSLFWDKTNWQAMSKPCHDRKTARQDGGFGR